MFDSIVFICIGSNKVTGDCLGPLVGSYLKSMYKATVYGDMENPINYQNAEKIMKKLENNNGESLKVVIDSALGKNIGDIIIDEAIIVVKDKRKAVDIDCLKNTNSKEKNKEEIVQGYMKDEDFKKIERIERDNRQFVVKEAEMVIKNYLQRIEDGQRVIDKNKLKKKYNRLKYINFVLLAISILSTLVCVAR